MPRPEGNERKLEPKGRTPLKRRGRRTAKKNRSHSLESISALFVTQPVLCAPTLCKAQRAASLLLLLLYNAL